MSPTPHRSHAGITTMVTRLAAYALVLIFSSVAATAAPPPSAVFPRTAAALSPIALPDLILEALPVAGEQLYGWDHMVDAPILWVTNGYSSSKTNAERIGVARVRVANRASTVLRQRREELAWTVTMQTEGNVKFGPNTIEIAPGVDNEPCFGSLFDNCEFDESEALANPKLSKRVVCRVTPGGFPLAVYRVTAPGKGPAFVRVWTSGGSGGVSSSVTMSLAPLDCSY